MLFIKDLGMKFPTSNSKKKIRFGLYECPICLTPFETVTTTVKQGKSTKCKSCSISLLNTTHGKSKDVNASRWYKMMTRCYNTSHKAFKDYGGRGITVAENLKDISIYCEYLASLPDANKKGYTVDRKDNTKGYEVGNLRWAPWEVQNTNQRKKRTSQFDYIGVYQLDKSTKYGYRIRVDGNRIYKGGFTTQRLAAIARDEFIKLHDLPHVLTGAV